MMTTGRALDVAIPGDAFLTVSANGQNAYTRAGAIQMQADGVLCDVKGNPLVGQSGKPITIPKGAGADGVRIGANGEVLALQSSNGKMEYGEVDRLQLATLDRQSLLALGDRLYSGTATPVPKDQVAVTTDTLEGSNVNVVSSMVEMITALRAYEANSRMVQALDGVVGKAVNELK
jgi:flagellar basal body rod protein FlgG